MTKVLFGRNGKLELTPYTQNNKPNLNGGGKNKIIVRKMQETIRKRLNRTTTEPSSSKNTNNS